MAGDTQLSKHSPAHATAVRRSGRRTNRCTTTPRCMPDKQTTLGYLKNPPLGVFKDRPTCGICGTYEADLTGGGRPGAVRVSRTKGASQLRPLLRMARPPAHADCAPQPVSQRGARTRWMPDVLYITTRKLANGVWCAVWQRRIGWQQRTVWQRAPRYARLANKKGFGVNAPGSCDAVAPIGQEAACKRAVPMGRKPQHPSSRRFCSSRSASRRFGRACSAALKQAHQPALLLASRRFSRPPLSLLAHRPSFHARDEPALLSERCGLPAAAAPNCPTPNVNAPVPVAGHATGGAPARTAAAPTEPARANAGGGGVCERSEAEWRIGLPAVTPGGMFASGMEPWDAGSLKAPA
eukprot:364246-Chlamydomonas_euryale.AAC.4